MVLWLGDTELSARGVQQNKIFSLVFDVFHDDTLIALFQKI